MWNLKCTIVPVIIGATGIVTRSLRKNLEAATGKTFDRFTTKDSYTWNITHNTESTAVWSLKRERWRSPLVQKKYQAEKACDRRHTYCIIIIIIIIIYNLLLLYLWLLLTIRTSIFTLNVVYGTDSIHSVMLISYFYWSHRSMINNQRSCHWGNEK